MADVAFAGAQMTATYVAKTAGRCVASLHQDHYNEDEVKKMALDSLDQIISKVDKLLYVKFKTARQVVNTWSNSTEPMDSETQRGRLNKVIDLSLEAFNTVEGSSDKLRALYFLIVATYHQVAISNRKRGDGNGGGVDWDWYAGKREAQTMFKQYITGFLELQSAAHEVLETGATRYFIYRNRKKRNELLGGFIELSATLFNLQPHVLNNEHPRFLQLDQAVQKACINDRTMLPYKMPLILSDPVLRATLKGHSGYVKCCAVFDNGRKALTGGYDTMLKVWDLSTGKQLLKLEGHKGYVTCCTVFDNGRKALSGSWDPRLIVSDLSTGKQLFKLEGHSGSVRCCAVFDNDRKALSGSKDRPLIVWDLSTGKQLFMLEGHTKGVNCCAVFDNDRKALSGSSDKMLIVWDLSTGKQLFKLEGHTDGVRCCAVFDNDRKALSGSDDKTLIVWDLSTAQQLFKLEGHTSRVTCCTVFINDRKALSGSSDKTLIVWDLSTGKQLFMLEGHTDEVNCCVVFDNARKVLSGSDDKTLKIWEFPASLKEVRYVWPHMGLQGDITDLFLGCGVAVAYAIGIWGLWTFPGS